MPTEQEPATMKENDLAIVGQPPEGATHWQCNREPAGRGTAGPALEADFDDVGALISLHRLESLSVEAMRREWGGGRYRIRWVRETDGKRTFVGGGAAFTLPDEVVTATAAPRHAPAAPTASFGSDALTLMQLLRAERADAQAAATQNMSAVVQLMGALGGGRVAGGGGLDEAARAQLELWQTRITHSFEAQLATVRAELATVRAELAAVRAELDSFEDVDDDGDDDGAPAREPPASIGEALSTNIVQGVDSGLQSLVPVLGPAAVELVDNLKRRTKADAERAELDAERARARGAPTAAPAAAAE